MRGRLIQLRRNEAAQRERCREANGQTDCDRAHALVDDQTEDVARLRTERHAHADFAGALSDRVRHGAVDADRCQHHGDAGEDSENPCHQARLSERLRHDRIHRLWLRHSESGIHSCQRRLHEVRRGLRLDSRRLAVAAEALCAMRMNPF